MKRIKLPDGTYGQFPDDMDDAAIEAVLQKQFAPPQEPSLMENFKQGAADLATGFGKVGGMLLTPYDAAEDVVRGRKVGTGATERRKMIESFGQEHGANDWTSTVNQVAPEIALTAGPMSGVSSAVGKEVAKVAIPKAVAKYAPKVAAKVGQALVKSAPAAADVATNAAWEAAKAGYRGETPEEIESAAKWGAGGAAAGRLLTKSVGRLGRPVKTSPITEMMLDEGIELTPGQAGGRIARAMEGNLYNTPFMPGLRRSVGQAQRIGQESAEDFLTHAGRLAANPAAHGLTDAQAQMFLEGARHVNDTGASRVPLTAILTMLHLPTGGATLAATSMLYGTNLGRAFLLGKLPYQELLRRAPELAPYAAQIGRAMTGESQAAPEEEQ